MIFRAIVLALLTINGAISQGLNNFGDVPGFGANNDGLGGSGQNLYQSPPRYYPIPPTSNQLSSNTYPSQPHSYSPPPDTPPNGFYPAASSGNLYTPPSSASLYPPPLNYNQKYPSSLLPQNPCPNYFQYSKNETNGAPIGIVFIKPFYTSQNYDLEVNMTVLDAVQQNDGLKISVQSGQQEILNGEVIKYAISFPYSARGAVPYLTQIKFNNQILCTGPAPPYSYDRNRSELSDRIVIRIITGEQNAPASTETAFANDLFSDSPVQSNFDSVGTQFDGAYVPSNPAEVNGAQFAGITGYLYDPQPFSEYFFALKIAVNPDSFAPKYQ